MSEFDYDDITAEAAELIQEFGSDCALRKAGVLTGPAYNPTVSPATDSVVAGVQDEFIAGFGGGGSIATSKRVIYVAGSADPAPATGDRIAFNLTAAAADIQAADGRPAWDLIENAKQIGPAGPVVLYRLELES